MKRWWRSLEQWFLESIERRLPLEEREYLIGDLLEELDRRRGQKGFWRSRWWGFRQVLGLVRHGWLMGAETQREIARNKDSTTLGADVKDLRTTLGQLGPTLYRDSKIGGRKLLRAPVPSLIIIATLALGIGLNSLVFMLADTVLFRPLPYEEPERLINLVNVDDRGGWYGSSEPEVLDLEQLSVFESVGALTEAAYVLESGERARRVLVARVNAALLPSLGVQPQFGRFPDREDDMPDAEPVAVVSHGFWRTELGARRAAVGESIRLRGESFEVIGVMPQGFHFPSQQVEAWIPLGIDRLDPWGRNNHYLGVFARLKDGIELEAARAAVTTLAGQSVMAHPEFYSGGYDPKLFELRRATTQNERVPMLLMLAAVTLLLMLTCANVASIQLGRAASRARELAVRGSLGASRGRLVTEMMIESLLLAAAGAAAALGVAYAGEALLPRLLPEQILRFGEPTLDGRVLAFTLVIALLTTLIFGLLPAMRSTRNAPGGGDVSMVALSRPGLRMRTLRSAMVVGQMGLACVLLIVSGLVARSLHEISQLDPGFAVAGVLAVELLPPDDAYESSEQLVEYYRRVDEVVAGIPDVAAVGAVARPPFSGMGNIWSFEIEGRPVDNIGEAPSAQVQQITPGALEALRIPLRRGRSFTARDTADSPAVVMVNEAFANQFWPGEVAIGKRIRVRHEDAPWMQVVGIVATVRDARLDLEGRSQWYVPHAQAFESAWISPRVMTLLVRTSSEQPTTLAPLVLSRLEELDDRVAVVGPSSLLAGLARTLALPRQMAVWLGMFAAVALGLAALGLYGVLSYLVALRRLEIGVRMALGAAPRSILFGILAEGLALCAFGLTLGVLGGVAMARAIRGSFYGAQAMDPWVIFSTICILLAIGALAPMPAAWRASRTNPVQVLRRE